MNNTAYNLELFEPLAPEVERKRTIERKKQQTERENRRNYITAIRKASIIMSAVVIFLGLNTVMIFNKVEINHLMVNQRNITKEIDVVEAENVRLRSEIKARTAYGSVIDYVENELGMVKADGSHVSYINTMTEGDQIVISGGKTCKK